jgi:hypothetical protein
VSARSTFDACRLSEISTFCCDALDEALTTYRHYGGPALWSAALGRKPTPRPSFLDTCEYVGYVYRERRWRNSMGHRLLTWDSLHGEIEAFDLRGRHVGALDVMTGEPIKQARSGRRTRV